MANLAGLGIFAGGLATGIRQGQDMALRANQDKRNQETHDQNKELKGLEIKRIKDEEPVRAKELQVRGLKADYQITEQGFLNDMQAFEQETRRLLAQGQRQGAQLAVGEGQAALQRQPDELSLRRQELNTRLTDSIQRQTANVWSMLQTGNKTSALEMFNNSRLLMPGQKATDFKIEDIEVPGPDGKVQKVPVLSVMTEGEGAKPMRIPVSQLEALRNRYGARYEKVGNNLVRIGPDGQVTPIYEQDQFMAVPEDGSVVSRRTGLPPAGGVPGAGAPRGGGPSPKENTRLNDQVKMAIDKVILPKYGGRFEGGMFFPDEKNKTVALRAQVLAEENIRKHNMQPIQAANAAIEQAEREAKLASMQGGGQPAAQGGGQPSGYTGPKPWKN